MTRTALFGGSFNPIHNGHIGLARRIIADGWADEVWLLVSPQNPLKQSAELLDERLRLELAQKALEGENAVRVSDFEFLLPRPSYTWQTLAALTHQYPDRQFSLLIGADNWRIFDRWAHYSDILTHYSVLIYPRPAFPINEAELPSSVHVVSAPEFPFSSTDVRRAIRRGDDVSSMIPFSISADAVRMYRSHFLETDL